MSQQNNKKRGTFLPLFNLYRIDFISIYIPDVVRERQVAGRSESDGMIDK